MHYGCVKNMCCVHLVEPYILNICSPDNPDVYVQLLLAVPQTTLPT